MAFDFELSDSCRMNFPAGKSVCDGNCSTDNIWFQNGRCRLDELTYYDVYFILQRVPQAKIDLYKITTDPNLIALANATELFVDPIEDGLVSSRLINNPKNTLPFYTLFKGNI